MIDLGVYFVPKLHNLSGGDEQDAYRVRLGDPYLADMYI